MSPHLPLTPQEWFTVAELAERGLPGLPATKKGVQLVAAREGWAQRTGPAGEALCRKRQGRGGGLEYNLSLLPEAARARLLVARPATPERLDRDAAWARWERLPEGMKAEARARLDTIVWIEQQQRQGMPKDRAVKQAAQAAGRGASAIYTWFKRIEGVRTDDRAVYLVPDYAGRQSTAECPPEALEVYKGLYLRQSEPTHAESYRQLQRTAKTEGWAIPSEKTLQRLLDAAVPRDVQVLLRKGPRAAEHTIAHADRKRPDFPLQVANLDGHTWDVFVQWEDGEIGRPISLAVQDIASGMPLAIRFDRTLNHHLVRLALGDVFRDFGLIDRLIMDNGRENQAAAISGGTSRFRKRAAEEEPVGLLKLLGVEAVFAKPYWGQAKPVERMFRNWAGSLAKHPAFEGAYTGNKPTAKPENYRERAIPFAEFERIVRSELGEYARQPGRKGQGMNGRSFLQAYEDGIALRPPRRPSAAQLQLCMLASNPVTMDRDDGSVRVMDHRYWSPALAGIKRQKVIVRFDPDDLARPVHVYSLAGRWLCQADRTLQGSFDSVADAMKIERARTAHRRVLKAAGKSARRLEAAEVAARLPQPGPLKPPPADPKVVAPDFRAPRRPEDLELAPERRRAAAGGGSADRFNALFDLQAQRLVKGGG